MPHAPLVSLVNNQFSALYPRRSYWQELGSDEVIPYRRDIHGIVRFPLAFLQGVLAFTPDGCTKEAVKLCGLAWKWQHGSPYTREIVKKHLAHESFCTTADIVDILGKGVNEHDFIYTGVLRSQMCGKRHFLLKSDVVELQQRRDALTVYDVAAELCIATRSVHTLVRRGKLTPLPGRGVRGPSFRFARSEVQQYKDRLAAAQELAGAYEWAVGRVQEELGISHGAVIEWVTRGILTRKTVEEHYVYSPAEVLHLKAERLRLNGGFEWLQHTTETPTLNTKATAKMLGITTVTANQWASLGLLPCHDLVLPAIQATSGRHDRQFNTDYIRRLALSVPSLPVRKAAAAAFKLAESAWHQQDQPTPLAT